jgi:dTDP-4-dehydrorhamnose reductase
MSSRVIVLGSSGMAGHVVTLTLGETTGLQVFDIGPRRKIFDSTYLIDVKKQVEIEHMIDQLRPDYLVNCIGVLVRESETNRLDAIWCNAYLPNLLSDICRNRSVKLIHLSTDCVFSGKNGPYAENSICDGNGYYDRTKVLGEITGGSDLTIRTSILGPELDPDGVGLFNWFMAQKGKVNGFSRALWSGVTTLQLAEFLRHMIASHVDLTGIIHYSTMPGISKFEIIRMLSIEFEKGIIVTPVPEPIVDKRLMNTRSDFRSNPPDYHEQFGAMKQWIFDHASLYPHYWKAQIQKKLRPTNEAANREPT